MNVETPAPAPLPAPAAFPIRGFARVPAVAWLALLAAAHLGWLLAHQAPAIMSPDANGYVVQARLLAERGATSFRTDSPAQFVGMHWLETDAGTFHSRYPAGLALLQAGAWKVAGLHAALLVNPLLASATLLLVFALARRVVRPGFALLAAGVVGLAPVANQHALDADAHIAAAFFLVAGVLALLRFGDTRSVAAGFVAGLLLGIVPAIRYPEALAGLAVAGWLAWRIRPLWRAWPAVLGAALPLGALMVHNAAAYGAFWKTGYALTNEQTGFGWDYFTSHALSYLIALGGQGLGLMFAFGVAGMAALAVSPRTRGEGVLFAGVAVPLVLLYMAYYFGGGGALGAQGNLRFLVPTFPFLAIGAAWLCAELADRIGAAGRVAVAVVVVIQFVVAAGLSQQMLTAAKVSLGAAARVRRLAEKEIPAGAVLVVDRQLAESLDATGRWKLVEESLVAGGGGPGMMGRPGGPGRPGAMRGGPRGAGGPGGAMAEDAPSPQQAGKNRGQQERYAGLAPGERQARVWEDVLAWAAGRPVYWFARSAETAGDRLPERATVHRVAEVEAPGMLGPGAMLAGAGGGGPPGMRGPGGRPGALRAPPGGRPVGPGGPRGFVPPGGGPGGFGPPGGPGMMDGANGATLTLLRIEGLGPSAARAQ